MQKSSCKVSKDIGRECKVAQKQSSQHDPSRAPYCTAVVFCQHGRLILFVCIVCTTIVSPHLDSPPPLYFFHRFNTKCDWLSFYLHFFIFFAEFSPNIDANLVENVVWSSVLVTVWMTYSLWIQQFKILPNPTTIKIQKWNFQMKSNYSLNRHEILDVYHQSSGTCTLLWNSHAHSAIEMVNSNLVNKMYPTISLTIITIIKKTEYMYLHETNIITECKGNQGVLLFVRRQQV